MRDDTIAVQKVCDQKESLILHRREKNWWSCWLLMEDMVRGVCVCACMYCCMYRHNIFMCVTLDVNINEWVLMGCMEMNDSE